MKTDVYVLDNNGIPTHYDDAEQWEFWMMQDEFHVAVTLAGDSEIHTTLMEVEDCGASNGAGFPFITTVKGGEWNGYYSRTPNWEQAEAEHAAIVRICEGGGDE